MSESGLYQGRTEARLRAPQRPADCSDDQRSANDRYKWVSSGIGEVIVGDAYRSGVCNPSDGPRLPSARQPRRLICS